MLSRWRRRRRWLWSGGFEADVQRAYDEVRSLYGDQALEIARGKFARRRQRLSRKWVWKAVVARLEGNGQRAATRSHIGDAAKAPAVAGDAPGNRPTALSSPRPSDYHPFPDNEESEA